MYSEKSDIAGVLQSHVLWKPALHHGQALVIISDGAGEHEGLG
jgi:hypothetical protein